jgi:hypothetical protein
MLGGEYCPVTVVNIQGFFLAKALFQSREINFSSYFLATFSHL